MHTCIRGNEIDSEIINNYTLKCNIKVSKYYSYIASDVALWQLINEPCAIVSWAKNNSGTEFSYRLIRLLTLYAWVTDYYNSIIIYLPL